jgi:gluconolactonase
MRAFLIGLSCISSVGLCACSNDASDDGVGGTSASVAGTGGADGGVNGLSGSGGGAGAANLDTPQGDVSLAGASSGGNSGSTPEDGGAGGAGGSADGGGSTLAGVCPPGPFAASPLPAGATAQTLCTGMTFTEGAVWFQERNTLFFSDFQIGNAAANFTGRIRSFTPGGQCQDFILGAGTNGLVIAPDGNLLGARHLDQTLTIFDLTTQQPTVFVADNGGLAFNSPNDIAVRSDGNLYFTDANYMLGNRTSEQPTRAYRRDPSGTLSVIDSGTNPNGIALSPDENRLYLSHLGGGGNNMLVFDVEASGAVADPQPFGNGSSDGMAIDCAGNVYATQGGVRIFDPEGELLGTIAAPGAANVAFGGPERRTLFITAGASLLSVELQIPGLPY